MQHLKKTVTLPLHDREYAVDVDFRVIEIVERAFDTSADAVIALFSDTRRVQRNRVADVIVGWLSYQDVALKRREIREHVMRAPTDTFALYLGVIYTALLFALQYIDEKGFDEVIESDRMKALRRAPVEEGDGKKKSPEASSPPATGSQSRRRR